MGAASTSEAEIQVLPKQSLTMSATGKSAHGSPVNVSVGSHVWVEDPTVAWIDGQVNRIDAPNNVHVQTSNGKKVVVDIKKVFQKDTKAPTGGIDDMTNLPYVHEPGVLQNLAIRYELNEIYTYTGNILIAVNPFQNMPHLYDTQMMEQYKGQPLERVRPHVFAIAEAAYRAMINKGKSSILVTGESGAGKTETTHRLMQYLAHRGGRSGVEGRTVEQQVIESNLVLEAFGNAQTVKSHNSSRFGKFVEIQFDKTEISGATVQTYLLERSRVCQISDSERNYHCFYLLCAAPPEEREQYKLGSPKSFHYLNQSNCIERDGVNEDEVYRATRRAMDVVGIGEEEQEAIFRIVAAILHLGNIEFSKGKGIENSQLSVIKDDEKSRFHLNTAAELLKCDPKSLEDALIQRVMKTPKDDIRKNIDPDAIRDALAKTLYSRLFDWIVGKINISIKQDSKSETTIGVLDIPGFESTNHNSFEQFCINYASEKLQQHFIQHVFKMEQEDYKKEEITWDYIKFDDNQDVLDLIEKQQGGIIGLLNETCLFPESTHKTFAQKLYQAFTKHKRFTKPKFPTTDFTISHYAEEVTYMADLFLDKNKHHEVTEHLDLLRASKCSFVSGLFPTHPEESLKNSKLLSSIGTHFKEQLHSLMKTLSSTEPFYIRCVKPNDDLKPAIFENVIVDKQLRSAGILEAIKINCEPRKFTFDEFLHQFGVLAPKVLDGSYDGKAACQVVLNKMGLQDYQLGKTKAFLRSGQVAVLDARKEEILRDAALTFQRQIHIYNDKKKIKSMYQAAKRLLVEWPAAIRIQRNFRCYYARKFYLTMKESAVLLQSRIRAMIARNKFRKQTIKVQDTVKIGVLTFKVESLKAALLSAKQYAEEAKKDHADAEAKIMDLTKQLEMAMGKVDQLQDTTRRLEEKLSNREAEIQVLRRQALNMPATGKCAHGMALEDNLKEPLPVSEENPQKSLHEKQLQENQDLLIKCITKVLGFSSDKPVAASIIYKCLLQWRSFEANRTNVFDRIIQTIASAVEARENNEVLAYWLCNTSTLLELLQHTLKASGAASRTPQMQRSLSSLFGRMSQGLRASPQTAEISFLNGSMLSRFDDLRQVEAKYPALLFKQQLAAFLEKIYGMIRDNLKKEIFPILGLCIQAPQTYRACLVKGNSEANGYAQQELTAHSTSIEQCLDKYLKTMNDNYVPPFLVGKIFAQIFSFINVLLFNSLLLRREFCSFSNGEYLEKLLAKLKEWCSSPAKEYYNVGPAWDELKHIRQAVKFLVLPQKDNKTFNQIRNDLCPVLSIRQLYRISFLYWDPKFFAPNVSPAVISRMRVLMTEDSNNSVSSNSFLLNDDSSIPFFVDDHIFKAMQHIDVSDEDSPIIP